MKILIVTTTDGPAKEYDLWANATGPLGIGWSKVNEDPAVFEKQFGDTAKAVLLYEQPRLDERLAKVRGFVNNNYGARLADFDGVYAAAHRNGLWQVLKSTREANFHIAPLPHLEGSKVYQAVRRIVEDPNHSIVIFDEVTQTIVRWGNYAERLRHLLHDLTNVLIPVDLDLQTLTLGGFSEVAFAEVARRHGARKDPAILEVVKRLLLPASKGTECVRTVYLDIESAIQSVPSEMQKAWKKVCACYPGTTPVQSNDERYLKAPDLLNNVRAILEDLSDPGKRLAVKSRFQDCNPFNQWFVLLDEAMEELITSVEAIKTQ